MSYCMARIMLSKFVKRLVYEDKGGIDVTDHNSGFMAFFEREE